jgi:hypothetical protein
VLVNIVKTILGQNVWIGFKTEPGLRFTPSGLTYKIVWNVREERH